MRRLFAAVTSIIVAAVVLAVSPTAAHAYTFTGCKHINNPVLLTNLSSSTYQSPGNAAATSWNFPGAYITFTLSSTGYIAAISDYAFGNLGYDGITAYDGYAANGSANCGTDGWIQSFVSWWNKYYTDSYTSTAKQSVMAHELGHGLGLGHAGTSTCSGQPLMYAYTSRYTTCGHVVPQADDQNGIQNLY